MVKMLTTNPVNELKPHKTPIHANPVHKKSKQSTGNRENKHQEAVHVQTVLKL